MTPKRSELLIMSFLYRSERLRMPRPSLWVPKTRSSALEGVVARGAYGSAHDTQTLRAPDHVLPLQIGTFGDAPSKPVGAENSIIRARGRCGARCVRFCP